MNEVQLRLCAGENRGTMFEITPFLASGQRTAGRLQGVRQGGRPARQRRNQTQTMQRRAERPKAGHDLAHQRKQEAVRQSPGPGPGNHQLHAGGNGALNATRCKIKDGSVNRFRQNATIFELLV